MSLRKTFLFVAGVGSVLILSFVSGCRTTDSSEAKIWNGQQLKNSSHPSANQILRASVKILRDGRIICTGTLISSRIVVTAAHCLLAAPRSTDKSLHSGSYELGFFDGTGEKIVKIDNVSQGKAHEAYSYNQKQTGPDVRNDIGFFELRSDAPRGTVVAPIFQSNRNLPMISVDTKKIKSRGLLAVVAGFGRLSTRAQPSQELMGTNGELALTIHQGAKLAFILPLGGVCNADSGGGTFSWDGKNIAILGVTSQGSCDFYHTDNNGTAIAAKQYEFYLATELAYFKKWIQDHTAMRDIKVTQYGTRVSDVDLDFDMVKTNLEFFQTGK